MSTFNIIMPKLGESVIEATITKWLKKPGDVISEDDPLVEIATDKVDSEVPSPVEGVLDKIFFDEGSVVAVGAVIATIKMAGEENDSAPDEIAQTIIDAPEAESLNTDKPSTEAKKSGDRFYSPLVKNIASSEGISHEELETITGSGEKGRVTKTDLLKYLEERNKKMTAVSKPAIQTPALTATAQPVQGDEIVQMDRMRKLIAEHMVQSKKVSPHVTSFIEVDMSKAVSWRESNKAVFEQKYNTKLTYTHIILHATAQALREFPMVNSSVDGDKIIIRKNIHIGMATALPNGNLIVPVIRDADMLNLPGMAKVAGDLAAKARNNKLSPDEISGGTFTFTNLGSFGSLTGTPIINQPQVAILAAGVIAKKPVVIESPEGDSIGIRPMMILSLSYDHRIVDGALGGLFIQKVKQLLETSDYKLLY